MHPHHRPGVIILHRETHTQQIFCLIEQGEVEQSQHGGCRPLGTFLCAIRAAACRDNANIHHSYYTQASRYTHTSLDLCAQMEVWLILTRRWRKGNLQVVFFSKIFYWAIEDSGAHAGEKDASICLELPFSCTPVECTHDCCWHFIHSCIYTDRYPARCASQQVVRNWIATV